MSERPTSWPWERMNQGNAGAHDVLAALLEPKPGERWLDVGTGGGGLASSGSRAAALRSSASTSPRTASSTPAPRPRSREARATFERADAQELPYEDGSFDGVASAFGVIFAADRERAAAELARVCAPGGKLGLTLMPLDSRTGATFSLLARYGGSDLPSGHLAGRGRTAPRRGLRARGRAGGVAGAAPAAAGMGRGGSEPRAAAERGGASRRRRRRRPPGRARRRRDATPTAPPATTSCSGDGAERVGAAARRGGRPAPAAAPAEHGQPARERDDRGGAAARVPGGERRRGRAVRARARADEPRRAPARRRRPSLCFLSHTDTVVAAPDEWSRDPWSGDLADDHVWGRGALDMKNQVAASAVAIASLAREGFVPPGEISSSSRRPTRRSARTTVSSGSASTIPTRSASTTRSTRAAASGSSSAAGPSTSARPPRR